MNMEKHNMESNKNATQVAAESKSARQSTLGNHQADSQVRTAGSGNTSDQESNCPRCGRQVEPLDSFADSRTVRCPRCLRCALIKSSPLIRTVIPLKDFHLKRGVGCTLRPFDEMEMAEELVECLKHDRWPSIATVVDFGIDTPSHLGALQSAYWGGCNVYDLDRVLGDGNAITQLVQAVPEQRYPDVRFVTVYDDCRLSHCCRKWLEEEHQS